MEDPELVPADHEDRLPPVALVHDYFVQDGGAEAVALELARMFPDAPMHTTFFERERFAERIDPRRIRPWPLADRVPASPWFRPLLPAYIAHFSGLEVPASRLVISNSSTFARGIHARRPAVHVATSTPRCASRGTSTPTLPTRAFRGSRSWGSTSRRPACGVGIDGPAGGPTSSSSTR